MKTNFRSQISNLKSQISNLKSQISNLKSQVSNLKSQISSITFLILALLAGSLAFAADPPRSTDDQLRDSLDAKTGDDYDRELLGDSAKPNTKDKVDDQMQKKLQQELGPAAQKEDKPKDPLLKVAEDMRDAQKRLDRRDSGKETQFVQGQIVADLAKLIEQAKKSGSCKGGKPGLRKPTGNKLAQKPGQAPGKSSAPAQRSDPKIRTPEEIAAEKEAKARQWTIEAVQLELQQRPNHEQMLELPSEYFLPEYKLEIEDYFRRLSEDQPPAEKR